MAEHLVTGHAGVGHVTSADAGLFNAGICGTGRYVLKSTGQFAHTLVNNNEIKIGSGDLVDQGRHISIAPNTDVTLSIDNGSQGKKRIDVVAMRYSKNTSTGVESAALVILKGTEVASGSTPTPAAVTQGDILTGATTDDTPLYHIAIDGLQVTGVTPVFEMMSSITSLIPDCTSLILDSVYPVGSIYMSVASTSPATLFGGTWTAIGGRFLLAADTNHAAGSTGGAESTTLTVNNLPDHKHGFDYDRLGVADSSSESYGFEYKKVRRMTPQTISTEGVIRDTPIGQGVIHGTPNQSFTNMPPYLAVYVWKRVA